MMQSFLAFRDSPIIPLRRSPSERAQPTANGDATRRRRRDSRRVVLLRGWMDGWMHGSWMRRPHSAVVVFHSWALSRGEMTLHWRTLNLKRTSEGNFLLIIGWHLQLDAWFCGSRASLSLLSYLKVSTNVQGATPSEII